MQLFSLLVPQAEIPEVRDSLEVPCGDETILGCNGLQTLGQSIRVFKNVLESWTERQTFIRCLELIMWLSMSAIFQENILCDVEIGGFDYMYLELEYQR